MACESWPPVMSAPYILRSVETTPPTPNKEPRGRTRSDHGATPRDESGPRRMASSGSRTPIRNGTTPNGMRRRTGTSLDTTAARTDESTSFFGAITPCFRQVSPLAQRRLSYTEKYCAGTVLEAHRGRLGIRRHGDHGPGNWWPMTTAAETGIGLWFDHETGMESLRVQLSHQVVSRGARICGLRSGVSGDDVGSTDHTTCRVRRVDGICGRQAS